MVAKYGRISNGEVTVWTWVNFLILSSTKRLNINILSKWAILGFNITCTYFSGLINWRKLPTNVFKTGGGCACLWSGGCVCFRGGICSSGGCLPLVPGVSAPGGGGACLWLGGACLWSWKGVHPSMQWGRPPPPVNRILDTRFWKYYLAPTSLRAVISTVDLSWILTTTTNERHWTGAGPWYPWTRQ